MAGQLWIPGVERRQRHPGCPLVGGPAHAIWHYTADRLNADGSRAATFDGTANYLLTENFEPTVQIDPFTGRVLQFLPADVGAYAVVHQGDPQTNREGTVCLQVEWFFTPGTVINGKRYERLTDTPLHGLDKWLALCRSWGVPDKFPEGNPGVQTRDPIFWTSHGGHYGHSQVPENTHTDPGPLDLTKVFGHVVVHNPYPVPTLPPDMRRWPTLADAQAHVSDRTRFVQWALDINPDGIFWTGTDAALRAFQRHLGLVDDGIVGPNTLAALRAVTR